MLPNEGRNKAILYSHAEEFSTGSLVLTISLDDFDQDYGAGEIPEDLERASDFILGAFRLTL